MHRLQSLLIISFYYTFGIAFLWVFLKVTFNNQIYSFNTLHVVLYVIAWLLATSYTYKKFNKNEGILYKHEKKIAVTWLLILFTLQMYCGYLLAVTTSWDTEAVFRGAINLNERGYLDNYSEYFHVFPHNLGATSLLRFLFWAFSADSIQEYYWIATSYNVISITTSIVFGYLICRELHNAKTAFLFLWLSTFCIPIYFYTPIFYSDTLSLPLVMVTYYLYLLLLKSEITKQKIILASLLAIACSLGTLIKFTVAIIAIAIFIDLLLRGNIKRLWTSIIVVVSIFYICLSSFNYYRAHHLLDEEISERKQIPYTHWVMMGLSGNGAYNGSDYGYTHSYPTMETRTQANLQKINERLHDYGIGGYLEFLQRKQQLNFGSGIYGVNEMIDDGPLRPNSLHQIALDTGKHYEKFRHFAQGHHVFIFLLIILSAFYDAATRKHNAINKLGLRLSIIGIFVFLALWEANSRYIFNFIPIFIACAALGFPDLYKVMCIIKNTLSKHIQEVRALNSSHTS